MVSSPAQDSIPQKTIFRICFILYLRTQSCVFKSYSKLQKDGSQLDYTTSIEHQMLGRKIRRLLFIRLKKRNIDLLTISAKARTLKFII
jgi:hypothetical protein